jgi:hypothetical protein
VPLDVQLLQTVGDAAILGLRILIVLGLLEDVQILGVGLVESIS